MSAQSQLRFKAISDTVEKYKKIFYSLNIIVVVHDLEGSCATDCNSVGDGSCGTTGKTDPITGGVLVVIVAPDPITGICP